MAKKQDAQKEMKTKSSTTYITQKAFNEYFSLDSHAAKNLIADDMLAHNEKNQIADYELSRSKDEVSKMAAGARRHTLTSAGEYLGISASTVKRLIGKLGISPVDSYRGMYSNWVSLYAQRDLDLIKQSDDYAKSLARAKKSQRSKENSKKRLDEYLEKIDSRVEVNIRTRTRPLPHAHMFLGPTNSGKTFAAIEEMSTLYENDPHGRYVYAGPLRLLAYEVYEKLSARFGIGSVGFVTGEEQINPDAPILCCTTECAPVSGTVLVLDETHWIVDDDRGRHWTNLLIGADYEHLFAISAAETKDVVSALLESSIDTETRTFSRLLPVEYAGTTPISQVPPKSAIVAFSRKAVLALAREVSRRTKRSVGVLYGAMPLMTRKRILDDYANGIYDVIVCTDVIGHGINLPIDNLIFAETQKYDGTIRRELRTWEAAQIAGRAGRYGISEKKGRVSVLSGLPWLSPNKELSKKAVKVANGEMRADLSVKKSYITPSFEDIAAEKPVEVLYALECWERKAAETCKGTALAPSPMPNKKALIKAIASYSNAEAYPKATAMDDRWQITAEQLWKLSDAPLDPQSNILSDIVEWANSDDPDESNALASPLNWLAAVSANNDMDEDAVISRFDERKAQLEQWAASVSPEELEELERDAAEKKELAEYNKGVSTKRKKAKKRNKAARKQAKAQGTTPVLEELPLWKMPDGSFTDHGGMVYTASKWNSEFSNVPLARNVEKRRRRLENDIADAIIACRRRAADVMELQERTYRELCQLMTIYNIFGSLGKAPVDDVEKAILRTCCAEEGHMEFGIAHNAYGICERCGGQCAPWFFECDQCHSARMSWRYGGYYDDDWW